MRAGEGTRARRVLRGLPALLLLAFATGCGPRYDRGGMLEGIGTGVILPAHEALLTEAVRLEEAAVAFGGSPTEAGLTDLRERWLAANLAWRGVQLFQFEGLLILHNGIEKRPPRTDFIEGTIAERSAGRRGPIDPAFLSGVGSTSKGLGAIEYLLFPSEATDPEVVASFGDDGRVEYLTALTGDLVVTARALLDHWAPTGNAYLATFVENDSDGADVQGSVSRLSSRIIELWETAARDWLGRPTGRTTDGVPRAEYVEAPLSGRSLELLVATVESIERTFEAGLDDYLRHLDRRSSAPLADRVSAGFDSVLVALRAIRRPLEEAVVDRPAEVEAAYEAMREVTVLLKTEMAARLGITITFSDNDGD